jgi:5-methyltetrahydrofolate--homocysteine methyltransferase
MKDASQNALVASRLMTDGQQVGKELTERYQHLREEYHQEQERLLTLEEARKNKLNLFE